MKFCKGLIVILLCLVTVFSAGCARKAAPAEDEGESAITDKTEPVVTTAVAETTDNVPETDPEPAYVNPLTGLASESDLTCLRPVSIMVNNIRQSLPQEGICEADIMYECMAEGGITRLMMIVADYEKLGQVGSVRSARDYYIDYAQSYDCIFIHAGGSDYAYSTISARGIDHLDGVKGSADLYYKTNTFVRDPERLKYFSSEHTLMVKSGEGIAAGIKYAGIKTEKSAGQSEPVKFATWGENVSLGENAKHVKVVMSSYQTVDFVYSEKEGCYLRFQYNGEKHMDSANNAQLSYRNVILMVTETGAIPNDDKARIWMNTTGEGSGWYFTDGGGKKISWKKDSCDSVINYYYEDGTEVRLNRGKTMINVVPSYSADGITVDNDITLLS